MTMLHCLENGIAPTRPTDDGDVVVGVWTRRDALTATSRFLRSCGFAEDKTSDGYGYRYRRDEDTVIDVLLPEGLERQHAFPRTTSGRPGFSMEGGRQALARAERVPIIIDDATGQVRRPNLLGSLVVKAHAYVTDSRDVDRHAEDLVDSRTDRAQRPPRSPPTRASRRPQGTAQIPAPPHPRPPVLPGSR